MADGPEVPGGDPSAGLPSQVDDVAAAHALTGPLRAAFGVAVEAAKNAGLYPIAGGKVSWSDLNKIAAEFKLDHEIE